MIPHTAPPTWPANIAASRFASTIRRDPQGCRVALIGLADDLGVKLNNGRPGQKDGPRAFREALSRYGIAEPHGFDWPGVFDAGDIIPAEGSDEKALQETHRRVTEATTALLEYDLFPIAIGGGHDLTFPFVRAVMKRHPNMNGIYFDAHLDVRETMGSGMPFRRLIEECGVKRLDCFGSCPYVNSRQHREWFEAHGGRVHHGEYANGEGEIWGEEEWQGSMPPGDLFVSFDLDVMDVAYAPGVSATNPSGWSPWHMEDWVCSAGWCSRVRCFDIMELNPAFDQDGRTARLAAYFFLEFLRTFGQRSITLA